MIKRTLLYLISALMLAGCTPPQPVNVSRDALWKKFAHQSVDSLLLNWGAPQAETRLTDGSRLVTYNHSTILDGNSAGCEVSFLAHVPEYRIDNIAMKGDPYECQLLAGGRTGTTRRDTYMPPPYDPYVR